MTGSLAKAGLGRGIAEKQQDGLAPQIWTAQRPNEMPSQSLGLPGKEPADDSKEEAGPTQGSDVLPLLCHPRAVKCLG